MRKTLIFISLILMVSLLSLSSFAATKADVIAEARKNIPDGYDYLYMVQLENILMATDMTPEQGDRLVEMVAASNIIIGDKGHSLDKYSADERAVLLDYFDEACEMFGYTYEMEAFDSEIDWHSGDVICIVYDSQGELVGAFDGDQEQLIKKTDAPINTIEILDLRYVAIIAAGSILMAVGITLSLKNRKFLTNV